MMKKMFSIKDIQRHAQKLVKFNTAPKFGLVRRFSGVKAPNKGIVTKNSFKMTKKLELNQGKNCVKNLGNSLVLKNSVNFNTIFMRNFCVKNTVETREINQYLDIKTDPNFDAKFKNCFDEKYKTKHEQQRNSDTLISFIYVVLSKNFGLGNSDTINSHIYISKYGVMENENMTITEILICVFFAPFIFIGYVLVLIWFCLVIAGFMGLTRYICGYEDTR